MSFQNQGRVSHGFATWNSLRRASDPAPTLREGRIAWSLIHFPRTGTYLVCDGEGVTLGRGTSAEEAIDHAIQRAEESAA